MWMKLPDLFTIYEFIQVTECKLTFRLIGYQRTENKKLGVVQVKSKTKSNVPKISK